MHQREYNREMINWRNSSCMGATVMELEGTVQNGVIVVNSPDPLPEGTKVKIVVETPGEPARKSTLGERLLKHAGTVTDLPPDMAEQHDHYIHGTPKR
jgi:hypothetical protein